MTQGAGPSPRSGRYRPPALLAGSLGLHAAGALALAAAPGHWPAVAGALFADHLVLAAASLWPRSSWVGPNQRRLPAAAAARARGGPDFRRRPRPGRHPAGAGSAGSPRRPRHLLLHRPPGALLPEIAAEIVRRGHRVENHTATHPHLFACYLAPALRREVAGAQEAIAATTGRAPRLFRAPAGLRNPLLDWVLFRAGLRLVSWTRRGFDALDNDAGRVARRLLAGLAAGDVLLLHDGAAHRPRGGNPVVLEALPRVLDGLAARSLRSVVLETAR